MNLGIIAKIIGVVLIVVGILGFVPQLTPGGLLVGYFMVDPLHNLVHIATGLIAFFMSFKENLARLFFQVFGVVYLIVALAGFYFSGNLFLLHVNMADNFLHLGIAVIFLLLGFGYRRTA